MPVPHNNSELENDSASKSEDESLRGEPTSTSEADRAVHVRRGLGVVAAAAFLGGWEYGFTLAIVAGAEPFLVEQFGLSNRQLGLVVSNLDLGAALGALLAGPLSDRWGRKNLFQATALVFLLSTSLTALATTVPVLLAGRALAGLAVGAAIIVPLYVAEIAPARWRGFLVSLVQIGIVTGILAAYFTGWLAVDAGTGNWRWMLAVGVIPALILCCVILALPESPRWLTSRGAMAAALNAFRSTMSREDAEAELRSVQLAVRTETSNWSDLMHPSMRRALVVGLMVTILSVTVGINAVILYGPVILMQGAGESVASALKGGVALGLVNFLFSLLALVLIDRMGRKPLLLSGLVGMGCSMLLLGSRLSLGPILAFVAFYAVSLGPIAWVLVSEVFPTKIRGAGMALCMVATYLADFLVTLSFPMMMDEFGRGVFYAYAAVCGLGMLLVATFVPETKGKSLEEIERLLSR